MKQLDNRISKILVAKLRHHGDVLLSSPVFSLLRKNFPQAVIDAYIYEETYPMLDGHKAINGFHLYSKKIAKKSFFSKIKQEWSLLKTIRKSSYDLVVNLTEGDRGAIAALVSGARYRAGFDPEGSGFLAKKKIYTHRCRICHGFRHTVERHLDVLRCLGLQVEEKDKNLTFEICQDVLKKMENLLKLYQINPHNFILIHPVSRWLFKCWDEKKIAGVVSYLIEKGYHIVLTASSDEKEKAVNKKILHFFQDSSYILDLSGKTSLKELGALVKLSKLLLCVDSVPMHIASALKSPVVALFGPTSEKTWAPWKNPLSQVVKDDSFPCRPCFMPGCGGCGVSDCIQSLSENRVIDAIEKVMEKTYPLETLHQLT